MAAGSTPAAQGEAKSASDILAAFRARVEKRIAGEPEKKPEENADGQTFYLTTSSAVRKRKEAEAEDWRKSLGPDIKKKGREDARASDRGSDRGRKRLPDEALDRGGVRTNGRRRGGNGPQPFWAPRRPRTKKVKVSNIPAGLQFKYLKELFEKATGKITEGHIDEETRIAWLTFDRAEDAVALSEEFDGGEISGCAIHVELLPEEKEEDKSKKEEKKEEKTEDQKAEDKHEKAETVENAEEKEGEDERWNPGAENRWSPSSSPA